VGPAATLMLLLLVLLMVMCRRIVREYGGEGGRG
jgi:hypothetical protein